jgi:chitinase
VTTYDVSRLDLDVEDRSLNRTAAVTRRNEAIHLVQQWAARQGRTVQFSYTLPASMTGLDPTGVHILADAVTHHASVTVVDAMAFDFYDGQPHEMGRDTVTVANAVIAQMHSVMPSLSRAQLWPHLGITTMIGIDDFGPAETLTLADARLVERWAAHHHLASLSFWAAERDNGGCPGQAGSDDCSGIAQSSWQFSHIFEPFTRA